MIRPGNMIRIEGHTEDMYPITKDYNTGDWQGKFTATGGNEMYTARYFPKEYWNVASFVCEGNAHLLHTDFMERNGSTWRAMQKRDANDPSKDKTNILQSADAYTAPIHAAVGPDGALWVVDWYNFMYLHNGSSPAGAGGAYNNELIRDHEVSRVYRVVRDDDKPLDPILDLSEATPAELVATLENTNLLWRQHAQRMLIKLYQESDPPADILALLEAYMTERRYADAVGIDAPVIHAMWTLEGIGAFESNPTKWNPILKDLLLHPSYAVRANVVQAMPRTTASAQAIRDQCALNDEDPHVRLQVLMAIDQMPQVSNMVMLNTYRNLDGHSQALFNDAGNKVSEVSSIPGSCPDLHENNLEGGCKDIRYGEYNAEAGAHDPDMCITGIEKDPGNPFAGAGLKYMKMGVASNGAVKMITAIGMRSGTVKIHTIDGKAVAERLFDGTSLNGSPLILERKLYIYTLYDKDMKVQHKGKVAGL